ncbi:uncharacterized protein LOC120008088 isoform X2 [Tripterygium wilfordii]|uniref:uncharacterized protein LOC120008088 isoform X2 n=1 Tax=Tripterygium wilfordii TaxID=458696 RepID=UPI0018F7FE39|nr:uncharacterized protein LOC120008088 isoform X2 [Tripterygium wilfordii]
MTMKTLQESRTQRRQLTLIDVQGEREVWFNGYKLGHIKENTHNFPSITMNMYKTHPSIPLSPKKMRWIQGWDFLLVFGLSIRYPWISKQTIFNLINSPNILQVLHYFCVLLLSCILPSYFHFASLLVLSISILEEMNRSPHSIPCLHCHPHSYIRMVQHLIERCLLLHMSREQCIKALAKHANIRPRITLTVWRELQRQNWNFFQAYFHTISPRPFMGGSNTTNRD